MEMTAKDDEGGRGSACDDSTVIPWRWQRWVIGIRGRGVVGIRWRRNFTNKVMP
jgi:hypothetical protein